VNKGRITQEIAIKRQNRIKIAEPEVCVSAFDIVFDFSGPLKDGESLLPEQIAATLKPEGMFATHHTGRVLKERTRSGISSDQIVGLSVVSPFRKYETVEILARVLTSEASLATLESFLTKIGKLPIRFHSVRKFKGYRIINAARFAADWLVLSGLSPNLIDLAMIDEGFEFGIYPQQDHEGLEICRERQFNWRERNFALFGYPFVIDPFIEKGRLGAKTGTGIYGYDAQGQITSFDETAQAIIAKLQNKEPYNPAVSSWDVATIIKDAMALEAIKMFASGTILDARDFDYMMMASYGIPEHIGGPFYYADQGGLTMFRERIREYYAAGNVFWYVEPLLDDLIQYGGQASDLRA
jgi:3-hydroxyacyl-CoA dehydrogenase